MNDFSDLRRALDAGTFDPDQVESWRDLYAEKKMEALEKKQGIAERLRKMKEEEASRREAKSVVMLDTRAAAAIVGKTKKSGWGNGAPTSEYYFFEYALPTARKETRRV
ncbi:hypothetical protein HK104_002840 [Borealophlyctis nickersoniae]|nr:hypothetical protein HK104_002840 [Borealophlyctis nickersoniae]